MADSERSNILSLPQEILVDIARRVISANAKRSNEDFFTAVQSIALSCRRFYYCSQDPKVCDVISARNIRNWDQLKRVHSFLIHLTNSNNMLRIRRFDLTFHSLGTFKNTTIEDVNRLKEIVTIVSSSPSLEKFIFNLPIPIKGVIDWLPFEIMDGLGTSSNPVRLVSFASMGFFPSQITMQQVMASSYGTLKQLYLCWAGTPNYLPWIRWALSLANADMLEAIALKNSFNVPMDGDERPYSQEFKGYKVLRRFKKLKTLEIPWRKAAIEAAAGIEQKTKFNLWIWQRPQILRTGDGGPSLDQILFPDILSSLCLDVAFDLSDKNLRGLWNSFPHVKTLMIYCRGIWNIPFLVTEIARRITGLRNFGLKWKKGTVTNIGFQRYLQMGEPGGPFGISDSMTALETVLINEDGLECPDEMMDFFAKVSPQANVVLTNDHSRYFRFGTDAFYS